MAVTHALVTACRTPYTLASVLQLMVKTRDLTEVVADTADCTAHAEMASVLEGWNRRLPADPALLWDWLLEQDAATLLEVLAAFAAPTLDAVHGRAFGGSLAHADQLADALDLDMAAHWQLSARTLERVDKRVMAEALTETGHAGLAADLAVLKKPVAAAKAAEALAGAGWLPPVLRRPVSAAANDNTLPEMDDAADPLEIAA